MDEGSVNVTDSALCAGDMVNNDDESNTAGSNPDSAVMSHGSGLGKLVYHSDQLHTSPIIHRRSRIGEILSIPDVRAALEDDVDDDERQNKFASRLFSRDVKASHRPPSPAFPRATIGSEDSPLNHFNFDYDEIENVPDLTELLDCGRIITSEGQEDDDKDSSSTSSESRRPSSDSSSSMVVCENEPDTPNQIVNEVSNRPLPSSELYDVISDSSRPLKTAQSQEQDEIMMSRRLSQSLNGNDIKPPIKPTDLPLREISAPGIPETKQECEGEEFERDIYDTYNRPTLSERRIMSKTRLFKTQSDSPTSGRTWQSLARAIARVRRNSAGDEGASDGQKRRLTPILKMRQKYQDPGSKPTLHKKTVSFSRLPNEAPIKNAADCVTLMQGGHQFVKMRSNARIYNRFYWFDVAAHCLRWEPSKKDQGKAKIDISSIKEVRPGKATELFFSSDISSHFPEECAFSIIYGDYKNLDLIAASVDEANIWITGLRCLLGGQDPEELQTRKDTRDTWLCSVFESADINGDGFLDEEESLELLKRLSDGVREIRIKQKLTEFLRFKDRDRTRLTKDEFVELFKDVTTRPEIYFLLARHASRDDRLSVEDLLLFLESEQGLSDTTREGCIDIIERFEPSLELKEIPAFGIDGFTKYLMSLECNIFDPAHSQVCQDMSQPLSHYYIASSHNTYLMEDQLSGPSSVSAYVRALLRCCRCIELDCWDGHGGKPVIKHGHTQSNSIDFEQTIQAIKECSFKNSPYPVILCVENHCCVEQQKILAETLTNVLGEQLYKEPPGIGYLPSPESLKNKFLIKGKKLPPDCEGVEGDVTDEDEGAEINDKTPPSPLMKPGTFSIGPGVLLSRQTPEENKPTVKRKLCRELSDLVSLCESVRMGAGESLSMHAKSRKHHDLTSMHERTASQLVMSSPEEFVNFNKKFITRVHPSAVRVDSSNFNPQDYWNCGVQIASLNYQTPGLMMDINDGRFAMNGGCGYVLKPTIMRDQVAYFSAQQHDVIPSVPPKVLHLRIISGQEFPKPRGGGAKGHVIDPYVLIELFGMPGDCSEQRTRTAHDCGSGNSTALFDESFEFRLTVPDLALVRFVVLDDEFIGDEFIGQYTIPFECLRPGYRHLRLRSIFDEPLDDATLFVHIAITDGNLPLGHGLSSSVGNPTSSPGIVPAQTTGSLSSGSFKLSNKRSSSTSALLKRSKKAQQQQQARRERAIAMRPLGIRKVDEIFKTTAQPLKDASEMRENLQNSLAYFKEVCGLSALSSVKQCVRNLAVRVNVETQQNTGSKKLSRKASLDSSLSTSTPVNGISSPGTPVSKMKDRNALNKGPGKGSFESLFTRTDSTGKLTLKMLYRDGLPLLEIYNLATQPPSAADMWRKVLTGFQSLVNDAKYVADNAMKCQENLSIINKEVLKYHQELPILLNEASGVSNDVTQVLSSPASNKKQKKKTPRSEKPKRIQLGVTNLQNIEWDFAWNCSVIRGHSEVLKSSSREAELLLSHLWDAGISSSLVSSEERAQNSSPVETPLESPESKLSNSGSDMSGDSAAGIQENGSTGTDSSEQNSGKESTTAVTENGNNNNNRNMEIVSRTNCTDQTNENEQTISGSHCLANTAPKMSGLQFTREESKARSMNCKPGSGEPQNILTSEKDQTVDSKGDFNSHIDKETLPVTIL